MNTSFELKEVSLSNLSKTHQHSFEEYDAKRPMIIFPDALIVTNTTYFGNFTSLACKQSNYWLQSYRST